MSDESNCCLTFLSIFLMICCSTNIILTSVQLGKQKSYGYDGILSMLDDNPLLLELNQKKCDNYISDIKYKKKISKIKTIIALSYNSIVFLYLLVRIKDFKVKCLIDIAFCVIMMVGFIVELVVVSLSLSYYNQTDYDSENFEKCNKINDSFFISEEIFDEAFTEFQWVINIDKGIISIVCIYFFPIFSYSILTLIKLSDDFDKHECIDKSFCCICNCLRNCFCGICDCFSNCCESLGNCCSKCFSGCCENCGQCCAKCCGNDYESLKEENDNLKKRNRELEKENDNLKKLNEEANNLITERKKERDEIMVLNSNNFINKTLENKYLEENNNLKERIIDYENQLTQLKIDNNNMIMTIKKLKASVLENSKEKQMKSIPIKKEELQMKAIEFYLRKEKEKDFKNNNNSFLKIFLLKEINEKYGLFLDSENFKKIALYYIKSKLTEYLSDQKNIDFKLISDPVIQKDGITLERSNVIQGNEFVENKLVFKIIEILNKNKNLQMIDFITIKTLLKNAKTNNFYDNPVVISNGNNIGETIEGDDYDIQNYKNLVIKNIINELREFFEDDFFNFQGLDNEDMKKFVDYNNIMIINFMSGDGVINCGIKCLKTDTFAEVEEKLYEKYEDYREYNNVFLHSGNTVLRFKTIEENNIKDSDKIIMQVFE